MTMVRAGRVTHPAEWVCGGFHELAGRRQRYRILNVPCLLACLDMKTETEFRDWYLRTIALVLATRAMEQANACTPNEAASNPQDDRAAPAPGGH